MSRRTWWERRCWERTCDGIEKGADSSDWGGEVAIDDVSLSIEDNIAS
jgi:hypothetical protein